MENKTPTPHDEPPGDLPADAPAVASDDWKLPVAPRRTRRRLIQLLGVTFGLVAVLAVQQFFLSGRRAEENKKEEACARARASLQEKIAQQDERWPKSAPTDLLTDLAVYLTFEPDTIQRFPKTTIVADLSGHAYHAVLHGAKPTEQGKVGAGVALGDDEDDYVVIPTIAREAFQSGEPVSVSMWVYETHYHHQCYPFHSGDPDYRVPGIAIGRDPIKRIYTFYVPTEQAMARSQECGLLAWHHLVGVWTGRQAEIYVDGKRACSKLRPPHLAIKSYSGWPYGLFLGICVNGSIDEVLIFSRRLFPDEVASLYRTGLAGKRPPLPDPSPSLTPFFATVDAHRAEEGRKFDVELEERMKARERAEANLEVVDDDSDLDTGNHSMSDHEKIRAYAITSDGKFVVVARLCGCLHQQSIPKMRSSIRFGRGQPDGCRLEGLEADPTSSKVACYGESGAICLWDTAKGRLTAIIDTSLKAVHSVRYPIDGKLILVGGDLADGDTKSSPLGLWDAATGEEIRRYSVPGQSVLATAISRDGARAAAWALGDKQFHIFDAASGRLIRSIPGEPASVSCMRFLPDGKRLLAGDRDGVLQFWDTETGKIVHEMRGHLAGINCVAVSDDGIFAASASDDGSARIWDLRSGCKLDDYTMSPRQDEPSVGSVWYVEFVTGRPDFWAGFSSGGMPCLRMPYVLDGPESAPASPAKP